MDGFVLADFSSKIGEVRFAENQWAPLVMPVVIVTKPYRPLS